MTDGIACIIIICIFFFLLFCCCQFRCLWHDSNLCRKHRLKSETEEFNCWGKQPKRKQQITTNELDRNTKTHINILYFPTKKKRYIKYCVCISSQKKTSKYLSLALSLCQSIVRLTAHTTKGSAVLFIFLFPLIY